MLGPHGCPPWVGQVLLVEDTESVRRSTKDSDAKDNDKASDDGLSHVERSGVDLHLDDRVLSSSGLIVLLVIEKGE